MAKRTQKLTAALAVSATLLTARAASATDIPVKATIVLHVDNFASLPSETLSKAEKAVTAIFADAGVSLELVDGRERAPRRDGQRHLKVLLLSREMSERKIAADGVGPTVLGQAARVPGRAYIFTHRVAELAKWYDLDDARLLARVIAHEIGHLLLPAHSHSARGIMCETLDMSGKVEPRFTKEQSTSLQEAIVSAN